MRSRVRADIFRRGKKVKLPAPERERVADRLAELGLLEVERFRVVRCVNSEDPDQKYLKDHACSGRIRLRPELDEDNHDYQCPECSRVVFPSRKRKYRMMRTSPDGDAIRGFVERLLGGLGVTVRESPVGLFRLEGEAGEVQVALADFCRDRAVFDPGYPHRHSLLFVVGNERDLGRWVPDAARSFHLLDLALDGAGPVLQREVRRLLRLDDGKAAAPASRGLAAMPPLVRREPEPAPSIDPYPEVRRVSVPSGTRWNQIEIYRVNGETVGVRAHGTACGHYTHIDLGMAHKRTKQPTKKWAILMGLCEAHGRLDWSGRSARDWSAHKQQVSELRPLLQHVFGIDADPFELSRQDGLRAAFVARPDPPGSETFVGDAWDPRRQI